MDAGLQLGVSPLPASVCSRQFTPKAARREKPTAIARDTGNPGEALYPKPGILLYNTKYHV